MLNIKLDLSYSGVIDKEISRYSQKVEKIYNNLLETADDKNEFAGWLKLPTMLKYTCNKGDKIWKN